MPGMKAAGLVTHPSFECPGAAWPAGGALGRRGPASPAPVRIAGPVLPPPRAAPPLGLGNPSLADPELFGSPQARSGNYRSEKAWSVHAEIPRSDPRRR